LDNEVSPTLGLGFCGYLSLFELSCFSLGLKLFLLKIKLDVLFRLVMYFIRDTTGL
jgi:hypothetical protein